MLLLCGSGICNPILPGSGRNGMFIHFKCITLSNGHQIFLLSQTFSCDKFMSM